MNGKTETGEAPSRTCPSCDADVPLASRECPICGEALVEEKDEGESREGALGGALSGFLMTEIDLLQRSSFEWVDLFGSEDALMATGFTAWGGIFWFEGQWYAVGGRKGAQTRLLGIGERPVCLAQADDWLNEHETDESAFKTSGWLNQPATEKQLRHLSPEARSDFGLTRYKASALITFNFNRRDVGRLVEGADGADRRAA